MLRGSFELIGDKSISHRAIMFSSISKGHNKISNFLMGQDCLSTISCFRKMGIDIEIKNNEVFVKGNGLYGLQRPNEILDVGNSGTTIRLMMGILAGNDFEVTLVGDDSIAKRPMKRVTDPLRLMGCDIKGKDDEEEQMLQYERENTSKLIRKLILY
jgi:3-phosphoshikimate 1-carboxyvinyltransferase